MAMTNRSQNCAPEEKIDNKIKFEFPKNDDIEIFGSFEKIKDISYGEIYKAVEKKNTTNVVAVKKIFNDDKENDGFPIDAIHEMLALKVLKHENIINLINICKDKRDYYLDGYDSTLPDPTTYLVFEYCEHDLPTLLSNSNIRFGLDEIKITMKQLLTGVNFIHSNNYIHNNIKPSHILVNKNGIIKLCDFRFAESTSLHMPKGEPEYVTRWYRSPELLLGEQKYTSKVDMWSIGCVMAELWTKAPILNGTSNQNQLELISKLCGTITPDVCSNVQKCSFLKAMPQNLKNQIKETFPQIGENENAIALLENFLTLNPSMRINAETALNHNFFSESVNPTSLETILSALKIE